MAQHGLDCFGALEHVMLQDGAYLGAGDVRIGDFVLLVDCDTRVPRDCVLPVITELLRSPRVAFTQHLISPMQARIAHAPAQSVPCLGSSVIVQNLCGPHRYYA